MARYTPEMRERGLRMLSDAHPEHPNLMTGIRHVAGMLGKSPEPLRMWQRRYEVDAGRRPGLTSDVLEEDRRLKLEVAELKRANEILKSASIFFAKELDRPTAR